MKKKLFIAAIAITALASCTSNDFVGDQDLQNGSSGTSGAISFNMSTPAITRAPQEGATAASTLNNNFVVFGYKTVNDIHQTVFNNYQVNYGTSSEHSSTSNSAGWEYVGYKNLPNGVGTDAGVTAFAATTTGNPNNSSAIDQSIKYWDYSASNYKFYAYSLGAGKTIDATTTYAKASKMPSDESTDKYTLSGDQKQLAACYISELTTISSPSTSAKEVDLRFLTIKSKIQLGFYETIPGYSVKDLKFYASGSEATASTTPVLYAGTSTLPKAGTYTVTFDNKGKPLLAWAADGSDGTQASILFESSLMNYATKDYQEAEAENTYLGRASNDATKTSEINVLPYATGADLTLKVDYTLLSRDGSGEIINVKGATAKVPAAYTQWKPNYKYTYLFKISDNTNGSTGGDITGLYPITLDAVVASEQDGSQETITTVSEPSITTYAKASAVTTDNEYKTNANIYVVVDMNGAVQELTVDKNAKLYTVTNTTGTGTTPEITEQSVANALLNGTKNNNTNPTTWTVTGVGMKSLEVTTSGAPTLTATDNIPATDSPTGVAITVNGAKFTPTTAGTYAFEFIDTNKKYYKIIKVVNN